MGAYMSGEDPRSGDLVKVVDVKDMVGGLKLGALRTVVEIQGLYLKLDGPDDGASWFPERFCLIARQQDDRRAVTHPGEETDEQKVRRVYPEATCNCFAGSCRIIDRYTGCGGERFLSYPKKTSEEAWKDAADRVEREAQRNAATANLPRYPDFIRGCLVYEFCIDWHSAWSFTG